MSEGTQQIPIPFEERVKYGQKALAKLAGAWTQKTPNLSGMRATFKRWRPTADREPTLGMRQYIWGWIGSPYQDQGDVPESETAEERKWRLIREKDEVQLIDQAATVVAMRAAAGDHDPHYSLGQALHKAGMSDMRLMRLLTAEKDGRLESLHRAMRLLDANKLGVQWTVREVGNVLNFVFGNDQEAQRAANKWASDFFRSRGKTEKGTDEDKKDESTAAE